MSNEWKADFEVSERFRNLASRYIFGNFDGKPRPTFNQVKEAARSLAAARDGVWGVMKNVFLGAPCDNILHELRYSFFWNVEASTPDDEGHREGLLRHLLDLDKIRQLRLVQIAEEEEVKEAA